jgi:peptidoglycan/LPS O-acetylase OafA/YrhL
MVVMGQAIGAAFFYFQAGPEFPLIAHTPVWRLLATMLIGMTLIPVSPSMDIRGWQEMHPLDGPAWSLFFEYAANILYAIGFRKLNLKWLSLFTGLSAAALAHLLLRGSSGDVIGGWSLTQHSLHVGFARVLFPFLMGMLLMRLGLRLRVRGSFFLSAALLATVLCWPRVGNAQTLWANGIYEAIAIIIVFPLILLIGADEEPAPGFTSKLCRFLGDISYPLYITHYALIYTYWAWVRTHPVPGPQAFVAAIGVFLSAVAIAYGCLKLYDEPVRALLGRRLVSAKA